MIHLGFQLKAQVFQVDTVYLCHEDSTLLDAGTGYQSYLWNTGKTTHSIYAKYSGLFQVEVITNDNLIVRDSIYVSLGQSSISFRDTVSCYNNDLQLSLSNYEPVCLVGYYPMSELIGGSFKDYSGYNNDMTSYSTVSFIDDHSNTGKAAYLTSNTLFIYSVPENYFDRSFTLHCWLRPDSIYGTAAGTDSSYFIIGHWNSFDESDMSNNNFALSVDNHGILSFMTSDGVRMNVFSLDSTNAILPSTWTMIDVVCSMNHLLMYINGNVVLDKPIDVFPQSLVGTDHSLYIVGSAPAPSYNHYYQGGISDLRIYTCDLSSEEIHNLMENTTTYNYNYDWSNQKDGELDLHTQSITIQPTDTIGQYYYVDISRENGLWSEIHCTDSVFVKSYPELFIDLKQIKTGCPDSNDGAFLADIYGGIPFSDTSYDYKAYKITWPKGYPHVDSLGWVSRLPKNTYTVAIEDSVGCTFSETIDIETYPEINDSIHIEPSVLYRQKPVIKFSNEYNSECFIVNYQWNFGDSTTSTEAEVEHNYGDIPDDVTTYDVRCVLTDDNGCIDSTIITLEVKNAKLNIPNVFTPNGDGVNDNFTITVQDDDDRLLSEVFESNTLSIYNRQGKLVYSKDNYESGEFDGKNLPDGVYFYVLRCNGQIKKETYSGYVHIFRKNSE